MHAALSGSLAVLDQHALAAAEVIQSTLVVPTSEDESRRRIRYTALRAVQEELQSSTEVTIELKVEDLLALTPAGRMMIQAERIVRLLTVCNQAAKVRGGEEIFKPTTRLIDACNRLQWLAATGRDSLGNIVDALFFLLYEGAGGENLRYWDYIAEDQAQIIWAIKHIRNTYLRHDPNHGSPGKIQKKWTSLSESLNWLGLERLPRSLEDYMHLQRNLFDQVEIFLGQLLQAI
jgi:hypothetical protein